MATKTIVGLLLAASVASGQSNLVPTGRSETIFIRGGCSRIEVTHNDYDTVAKEIHTPEFHTLLFQILKLPEDAKPRYTVTPRYQIQVGALGLTEKKADSLAVVVGDYVSSRARGHTAKYALDSLQQRLVESPNETNLFRRGLFETFPYLPRHWVKEYPFKSPTLSATNARPTYRFVVIDGEIAWTYAVPFSEIAWTSPVPPDTKRAPASGINVTAIDAQEFDPKLRPKFEAAEQEAAQNLEKKGIKNRWGYFLRFDAELNAVLWQKYQIKRRGYRELNPGSIVD